MVREDGRNWGDPVFCDGDLSEAARQQFIEQGETQIAEARENAVATEQGALNAVETQFQGGAEIFAGPGASPEPSVAIHLRSFAPFKSFGGGFEGDDRAHTVDTDPKVTSRISASMEIDIKTGKVVGTPTARSSPTRCAGPPCSTLLGSKTATSRPTVTTSTSGRTTVMVVSGANPLVPGAPDIDLKLTVTVRPDGTLTGNLVGDAFPNAEVFSIGPLPHGTVMNLRFSTPGGAETGPAMYLPGNNARPMGSF
jgi:hypothetical protein